MAKAAESTVQLNWAQIIVGAAGFLALLYSLALNRKATNFAGTSAELNREAVAAALRAAKAAEDSVAAGLRAALAAEAAVSGDRPWLINRQLKFGTISDAKGDLMGWSFTIVWRNTGRTPAIDCATALEPDLIDRDVDVGTYRFTGTPRMHRNTNAGAESDIQVRSDVVLMPDLEKVFSKTKRLMLYARVQYHVPSQADPKHTEVCFDVQPNGDRFRKKYDETPPDNVFTIVIAGAQQSAS